MAQRNTLLRTDCLPVLADLPDESIDAVITDPPYPNAAGLFTSSLIDGIAGLYLCAKKAKNVIVFFWTPLVDPPRPPPGWFHTSTSIWHKPDARSKIAYELIVTWTRDYQRRPHRVSTIPIVDLRSLKDYGQHPTQKPIRLLLSLVEHYTKPGELVLDPFAGTGTTAVAAKFLKRDYLAIETREEYATIAAKRLADPNTTTTSTSTTENLPVEMAKPNKKPKEERR